MVRAAARMAEAELARVQVALTTEAAAGTPAFRIDALGRLECHVEIDGQARWLSPRHSEIAVILADHPDGLSGDQLTIAAPDELTGQAIVAFIPLRAGIDEKGLEALLREHVAERIGKLARPKEIVFALDLPKTRSGKIMRRLLRDVTEGKELGDVSTLADSSVVAAIQQQLTGH